MLIQNSVWRYARWIEMARDEAPSYAQFHFLIVTDLPPIQPGEHDSQGIPGHW